MKPKTANSRESSMPAKRAPLVFTYHVISPERSSYAYSATCRQFDEHFSWLSTLHSEQANDSKIRIPEVTFDDGKASDHDFAMPLLDKHRIRATFFVTAGHIENQTGFMTWQQVRRVADSGQQVQSHGWSHLLLNSATEAELRNELEWSKKQIEDHIARPVTSLSLPGGRWNETVLRACKAAGYERVYHSNPWKPVDQRNGIEFIGRFMIRNSMSLSQLKSIADGDRFTLSILRGQHLLKSSGKRIFGDRIYHSLWRRLARASSSSSGAPIQPAPEGRD